MKKYQLLFLLVLSSVVIIYSCTQNSDTEKIQQFVPIEYDADLYGPSPAKRESGGQTTCSCSLGSSCSASKTCNSGQDCSCTCYSSHYAVHCSCGPCSGSGSGGISPGIEELWYTETQLGYWNQMQGILSTETSNASQQIQGYQLDALQAVVDNDYAAYNTAKVNFKNTLYLLNNNTKSQINSFYDQHDFLDERL